MYDVIILGGGVAGLTLAAALVPTGGRFAIIEANQPQPIVETNKHQRVSSINLVSQRIYEHLGVWQTLTSCSPFRHIEVWDDTRQGYLQFDSRALHTSHLGHIVPNHELQLALWQHLQQFPHQVSFYCPQRAMSIEQEADVVNVNLSDQSTISAKLLVGADGARSWLRQKLSINLHQKDYEHTAVVATIKTEKPHQKIARQRFLKTGPLALLPLLDDNKLSIVWSTTPQHAQVLVDDAASLANQIDNAFEHQLGAISVLDIPQSFPLTMRHVTEYVLPRIALLGDAAHTLHPLAGQGMNLAIMDAACLADIISSGLAKGDDIGRMKLLRRYERWRRGDNQTMIDAMSILAAVFKWQTPVLQTLRNQGLSITNHWQWLKKYFIRHAVGLRGDLPSLAAVRSTASVE